MSVPSHLGGLNWGRGTVSVGLTILIVILVGYVTLSHVDVEDAGTPRSMSPPFGHAELS